MTELITGKTAIVFGASGLVGRSLVMELIDNPDYSLIKIPGRSPLGLEHPKAREIKIDLSKLEDYEDIFKGDHLFICLGTTIRKAGSVSGMETIDRDYPLEIARQAFKNGVKRIAVVSSVGANPSSRNYYLRIKGEMEEGIRAIPFEQTVIARPSMLLGHRDEFRFGEWIAKGIMQLYNPFLVGKLRKYRGIHCQTVARALIGLIGSESRKVVYDKELTTF